MEPLKEMNHTTPDTKVALITGSARRIGASIAAALHQQGYNVIIHYHQSKKEADKAVDKLLTVRPNSAFAIQGDLQSLSDLPSIAASSIAQWGRIDLLVNNASCFYPTPISCKEPTRSEESLFNINDWNKILDTNLRAPYALSLLLADELRKTQGSIINLVDIYSQRPLQDHSIYNISKAGIAMMTQTLAKELAPDITVNGVSPGAILWPENESKDSKQNETQKRIITQTPLARCGSPADICEAVNFLAKSSFITGQIINVDGGRSLYL